MRLLALCLVAFALAPSFGFAQEPQSSHTHSCDLLAASPFDRARPADVAGILIEKVDAKAALPVCQNALAAEPDNIRLLFEMGRIFHLMNNYDQARAFYEAAANRGYATAQHNLAILYESGYGGLEKSDREAARLYKLAADQLNSAGQYRLGKFYAEGRGGLAKDEAEAARLFKLAADQGNAYGQVYLGRLYESGRGGLPKSEEEAVRLYQQAADQGNADGEFNLGRMYQFGRGVSEDRLQAMNLYRKAAEQGNLFARAAILNVETAQSPFGRARPVPYLDR